MRERALGRDVVAFHNMVTPYTDRLFAAVRASGVDLAVLACTRQEPNRRWADSIHPTYPLQVLRGWALRVGARRYAHLNRGIVRALRALRPRRLVVTGLYPSMVIAALWARATRTPFALHVDGDARHMPQTPYHAAVRALLLSRVAAVLTCSRAGQRYFVAQGVPSDRIVLMPIVPAWDGPAAPRPWDERSVDLLWVAELNHAIKNLGFFRDVVLALQRRCPRLRVHVVGAGPDAALLGSLHAAGIILRHDPVVEGGDMAAVYGAAKLLLLPSRHEPWGLVCHEAMQCGTPAIVSPLVGAAGDLVGDGNGAVVPLDVAAWVDRIDAILSDAATWRRLSAAAREACAARTVAVAVERYRAMLALLDAAPFHGGT